MPYTEIRELFNAWNDALATRDPEAVAALYADDAVLVPTLSNRVRRDQASIKEYFTEFLARGPYGTVDDSTTRMFDDMATHSGLYSFRFADGSVVPARFTFVYQRTPKGWMIIEHHSSLMPE